MSREWKPGDVAMLEVGCWSNRHVGVFVDGSWRYSDDKWAANDPAIITARPLVVIDPEDREQAGRLLDMYTERVQLPFRGEDEPDDWRTDRMQAALREFANPAPPKPACTAVLHIGSERIECERDDDDHSSDHRNDSIGQGVRWSA